MKSAVLLLPPSTLPARLLSPLMPPRARPARAANIAVPIPGMLGGMICAEDLYCFGKVKAKRRLSSSETAATPIRRRRRSHRILVFATHAGVTGTSGAIGAEVSGGILR